MDEMTIRVAIRTTARISFVLFLGSFLGDSLYRFWPTAATLWLKENKGRFTLGFAGSHTVHLVFILALVAALGPSHLLNELGWIVLVAFVTGFLFIYALAVGVLFRYHTFWSSRFEAVAHYFRGWFRAKRNNRTSLLHTFYSCRYHRNRGEGGCNSVEERARVACERRIAFECLGTRSHASGSVAEEMRCASGTSQFG